MNITLLSVLTAGLMPILWTGTAKILGARERRFDNRNARAWQQQLTGAAARAHAAHLNAFEAFPLFAAAVLSVLITDTGGESLDALAALYVALRLGYGLCYIADLATLRSLVWLSALICNVWIFSLAL